MVREDRPYDKEYWKTKRASSAIIYFRDAEEKHEFMRLAKSEGEAVFSRWVMQKLLVSLSGNVFAAGYVDNLHKDLEKYRAWLTSRDEQIVELRKDLRAITAERDDLRVVVAAVTGDATKAMLKQAKGLR